MGLNWATYIAWGKNSFGENLLDRLEDVVEPRHDIGIVVWWGDHSFDHVRIRGCVVRLE